ncbi:kinesin heavy chain-like [Montipora capricornis]|uniref:kinesin heavy chain-like n=1 Tax=Montipora capricornis TaxID=246305 RepID=UPI0035F0FE4A
MSFCWCSSYYYFVFVLCLMLFIEENYIGEEEIESKTENAEEGVEKKPSEDLLLAKFLVLEGQVKALNSKILLLELKNENLKECEKQVVNAQKIMKKYERQMEDHERQVLQFNDKVDFVQDNISKALKKYVEDHERQFLQFNDKVVFETLKKCERQVVGLHDKMAFLQSESQNISESMVAEVEVLKDYIFALKDDYENVSLTLEKENVEMLKLSGNVTLISSKLSEQSKQIYHLEDKLILFKEETLLQEKQLSLHFLFIHKRNFLNQRCHDYVEVKRERGKHVAVHSSEVDIDKLLGVFCFLEVEYPKYIWYQPEVVRYERRVQPEQFSFSCNCDVGNNVRENYNCVLYIQIKKKC